MNFLALLALTLSAHASPETDALARYVVTYQRAEAALQDFDAELDAAEREEKPGTLSRSSSYRELMALRILLTERSHALGEAYLELRRAPSEAARLRRKELEEKLLLLSPADRPAGFDLTERLRSHCSPAQCAGLAELKAPHATYELMRADMEANRDAVRAAVEKSRNDETLNAEIAEGASRLDFEGEAAAGPIKPGPGTNGNMNGYNFPERTYALTFDDGPNDDHTLPILKILQSFGKKATFFWLAENVGPKPGIVQKVKAAGMPRNNHSFTHLELPKQDHATLTKEIVGAQAVLKQVYKDTPRYFRCPFGAGLNIARVREMIAKNNMVHVFWTIDTIDWQDKDPASILARIKKQMAAEKRGIILMHDVHPQTVQATRLLLQYSKGLDGKKGQSLRWVTIPQIVDELNRRP